MPGSKKEQYCHNRFTKRLKNPVTADQIKKPKKTSCPVRKPTKKLALWFEIKKKFRDRSIVLKKNM